MLTPAFRHIQQIHTTFTFKKSPDPFTDETMSNVFGMVQCTHYTYTNTPTVENHSIWHFRINSQSIYSCLICILRNATVEREKKNWNLSYHFDFTVSNRIWRLFDIPSHHNMCVLSVYWFTMKITIYIELCEPKKWIHGSWWFFLYL